MIEKTVAVASFVAREGKAVSRQVDPATLMEGLLLKRGLVRVGSVDPAAMEKTLVLRWGISGKRDLLLGTGYAQEVTISLLDSRDLAPVFTCTAEGLGATDADDVREAITSCLSGLN